MQRWLQAIWYQGAFAPYTLRALSMVFAALAAIRRWCYRTGLFASVRLPVPVVVVGNISVGGTGKTPLTAWLANELAAAGLRVGIVLRGYGGRAAKPTLVTAASDPAVVGDEAVLLARRTPALVAVGRDRVAAGELLVAAGAQLILADDGLQHLRLQRDATLAVIDGERGFGNGRLLPAGPLREPPAVLGRVSVVVQNGGSRLRFPTALRMQLVGPELKPVAAADADAARPLATLGGQRVVVRRSGPDCRCRPRHARAARLELVEHAFPDHHRYAAGDIRFSDRFPVLMTEKDAVKCRGLADERHWYLPVAAVFAPFDQQLLLRRIIMDARLLDILVCPLCKGPLQNARASNELVCIPDRLAFPVRDGIPVMLEEEARVLGADDPLLKR
jgi:tetraacyldisaccharide 4'-kinase